VQSPRIIRFSVSLWIHKPADCQFDNLAPGKDFLKGFLLSARYPGMDLVARMLLAAAGYWWRLITLQSFAAFELARIGSRMRRRQCFKQKKELKMH
jgi:hypothetical protein